MTQRAQPNPPTVDLSGLLGSLQTLLLAGPRLEEFLGKVASLASAITNPPASCGITVHQDGEPVTVATSDDRAALVDQKQYDFHEGPCIDTLNTGDIIEVRDQSADMTWPKYNPAAAELGVRCSLSLPLSVDDETLGALNLYVFEEPHAFDGDQRARAETFAAQASTALALTVRHTEQADLTSQLEQALVSRTYIDQAVGIVMGQQRCDANQAFDILRRHSQNNNRRLRDVATDLINRVSGKPPVPPRPFER
ncbi:GAF domain-containing protein [Actinopolymorpha cephalotaxi]|uniref:GAF domain-containing protein n=1 Tax=Actinopolymorpha cephalotaxi TaxID=504797 RepID=A0A1I2LN77_9ACTN|nr:GAF and ANTAR domain-containing protein [Actinopolymorpha cephalotaxi]NYH84886.1 GAF domain-containing protein [Actinopolymorpha cephalotaxi]SFF78501.1 GAF domain-containing protein [Actinopolymorpha cephalotaxi]